MAEGLSKQNKSNITKQGEKSDKGDNLECAVCLQTCVFPAQLPCGHIFCFLCIKGIANQSKRCAMCRHEIPRDFLEHPNLLKHPTLHENPDIEEGYQWFYEGRNETYRYLLCQLEANIRLKGWWKYEKQASEEIEEAFKLKLKQYEMLICGELYVIDFELNVQYQKHRPSRRRNIKRCLQDDVNVKGIAGIQ